MSLSDGASDQPIRRAPLVYGRRSSNRPPPSPAGTAEEHGRDVPIALSHRRGSTPHVSDGERSPSPNAADSFQFGFRRKLKELDEQLDNHDTLSSEPDLSPGNKAVRAGLKGLQSVSTSTEASCSSRVSSPSSTFLRATYAPERAPGTSPVQRHSGRTLSPVPPRSEAEDPSDSSSVFHVRHSITTPHSRSSPTPPTSGETLMPSRKKKGKTPARDVLPLLFDDELPSAVEVPIKSRKGGRGEPSVRPKTKAPTKSERRETALEASRIAASRPVDVRRTQTQKHSLSAFFASLRRDDTVTLGTELPSDPIERFSSPTDKSALVQPTSSLFGAPLGLPSTSAHAGKTSQPSTSKDIDALAPAVAGSDDEMPSVASVIQQARGKQRRLQAIKQVVLQRADAGETMDDDNENDDLLIVKDDMHSVVREEAAHRRLDKAHGSPAKDRTSSRRINQSSVRPAAISPRKLSKQDLQELAKPSFARTGQGAKGQLSKKQLDLLMITQHTEEQLKSIKRQEEEWVKRGGQLSRDTRDDDTKTSLSQRLETYAEQGLKEVEIGDAVGDEASTDGSDGDYTPDLQGSSSPEPVEGDTPSSAEPPRPPGHDDGEKDGEEEEVIALKRSKYGQRRPRAVVGSDDEEEQPIQRSLPTVQRDSSMGSQTEDENDKENSANLMYDHSEDKENKAVTRHELPSPELAFGLRLGSLHAIGDEARRSPDYDDTKGSPKDIRSPLKDIPKDEDGFFLSPSSKPPLTGYLLQSLTISPPHTSAPILSLRSSPVFRIERVGQIDRLPSDSENTENDGFEALQPSFLETRSKSSPAAPSPLPNGGLSQLFSTGDLSLKKSVDRTEINDLALTLDVGLKPALEVSNTLRRKAEIIFEKEQEYVVAVAARQNDRPKEQLYVNDHGFLTQTRPEGSSPQIYRMTPSQASKFIGTQIYATQTQSFSARPPLRTLSFTTSQDLSPGPLRRLRKRSLSPLEQRALGQSSNPATKLNAFNILGKTPKLSPKVQEKMHDKSEFVAVEAEESDEDDAFGFGGPKEGDDEENENEQDKVVEGLLNDTPMDVETEAVDLVQEKYREHEAEDDQQLQRLHEDATKGKFRTKRRGRGVGVEEDSDDDDDDDERRIRQRIHKKRRIEGDNLEALGQNEETRAFYDTYHYDLVDKDDEFGYLRGDQITPDDGDTQAEEAGEQETVSVDEIRQRVREVAQNNCEVKTLDPEDTSWVDQSMMIETEDTFRVRVVDGRRNKSAVHRPNAGQTGFDEERATRYEESEQERKQMTSWAKNLNRGCQGTGRSGNSTAVTGHTKVKSGGGSLRSTQLSNPPTISAARRAKTSSLLSVVSSRSGKFA